MIKAWWVSFLLLILVGCSSYEPEKEPTKITFSLVSDNWVNPNAFGDASPIEIQVFELKDDSMFMSADYEQLKKDYKKALRSNFVKNYDYVLMPSQFKFISANNLPFRTNNDL